MIGNKGSTVGLDSSACRRELNGYAAYGKMFGGRIMPCSRKSLVELAIVFGGNRATEERSEMMTRKMIGLGLALGVVAMLAAKAESIRSRLTTPTPSRGSR